MLPLSKGDAGRFWLSISDVTLKIAAPLSILYVVGLLQPGLRLQVLLHCKLCKKDPVWQRLEELWCRVLASALWRHSAQGYLLQASSPSCTR